METRDVFRLKKAADIHNWVVISDTTTHPDCVLCVNWTTKDKFTDPACTLNPGEHPSIEYTSSIEYSRLVRASLAEWERCEKAGLVRKQKPVSSAVLQKIRDGARQSTRIKTGDLAALEEQGLIAPPDSKSNSSDPL